MIYTLTFSPSIDYYLTVDDFSYGAINRSHDERLTAGGKGINVSRLLRNLSISSTALGFIGGFTGDFVESVLKSEGIATDFVRIHGNTRINVKILSTKETAINADGPVINQSSIDELLTKLEKVKVGDFVSIGGTVPSGLPKSIYESIMKKLEGHGAKIIVDATGELLLKTLPYHPFLIKPNEDELSEVVGFQASNKENIIRGAKMLQKQGAQNIIVSRGDKGAVMISDKGQIIEKQAPAGKPVSTVAAGDSLIAGFLAGCLRFGDYEKALEFGLAAGSATVFSGHISSAELIADLFEKTYYGKE